ncbi:MAG: hypothetical protein KGM44_09435 [bacterium]|nr:hypothetical protein [bacterium]
MSSIIAPAKRVNLVPAGIAGGIIGGVLIHAFLLSISGFHVAILYQWIASNLVGKAAFGSTAYVGLGLLLHFLVAAAWGVIYALVAQCGRPALVNRPLPSGLLFGLVVLVVMQAVQVAFHTYVAPSQNWAQYALLVAAHLVFFGLPVALYVSAAARKAVAS